MHTIFWNYSIYLLLFLTISTIGCSEQRHIDQQDIVASVRDQALSIDELKSIVPSNIVKADSLEIVRSFVESWVREKMILEEAKRMYQNDEEILKMVTQYKESLMIHKFKKEFFSTQLDSITDEKLLRTYYNDHKSSIIAKSDLYQILFFRLSRLHPGVESFKRIWKNNENDLYNMDLSEICDIGNSRCLKDSTAWVNKQFILSLFPEKDQKKIHFQSSDRMSVYNNEEYLFLHITNRVKKGEIAPFHSVKQKLNTLALNAKKINLSKEITQDLYDKGISEGWIKINL